MVTKAELEAEVAELRRQLADQNSKAPDDSGHSIPESLEGWAHQIDDILTEFEDLPHKKPILFALGVFAVGYLIGRTR